MYPVGMAGGQQPKYNKKRHEVIVKALRAGNYRGVAAKLAGLAPSTLHGWLSDANENPDSLYWDLRCDVEQAEAEFEADMVEIVKDAALSGKPNTWQAAMTILERKDPSRWGRSDTLRVEGGDTPITVATLHLLQNPEQMAALLGNLSEIGGKAPAEITAGAEDFHLDSDEAL
jgi:hypothetical protein